MFRKITRATAHAVWFGFEVMGATAAGDGQSLNALYAAERERQARMPVRPVRRLAAGRIAGLAVTALMIAALAVMAVPGMLA